MNQFSEKMKGKWQMILIISVSIAAIVFSISAFITPKHRSDVSLLVIQKQPSSKVDAFSAAKSAEYLSDILARMVYTESFMRDVLSSPIEINREFSSDPEERKEEWKEMLEVRSVNNTGIIKVAVFDPSREEATKIAEAVGWALSVRGHNYHGGGERVVVRIIDGPITSARPAQPNIFLNTLIGLIIGLIIALAVVFFFPDLNLKIIDGKKEKKNQKTIDEKLGEELKEEHPETLSEVDEIGRADMPYEVISKKDETVIEDAKKEAEIEDAEEKKEEMENIERVSRVKKSSAPDDLPTFSDEDGQEAPSASEIAHGYAPERKEVSEEEVKDKLNRLLKGDI